MLLKQGLVKTAETSKTFVTLLRYCYSYKDRLKIKKRGGMNF